ncbi:unnamed protein product, partial [marine sediment metagenome]
MLRVHIIGGSRSGTTLMMQLMGACFDFEAYATRETSIFCLKTEKSIKGLRSFCSKHPVDIKNLKLLLKLNKNLHFIYMLRDPRDAVCSCLRRGDEITWVSLRMWFYKYKKMCNYIECDRFHVIKYEDLVTDPQKVQQHIQSKITALNKTADFIDFYKHVVPSVTINENLNGLRKIDSNSIGNWRNHMPVLLARMTEFGNIEAIANTIIMLG